MFLVCWIIGTIIGIIILYAIIKVAIDNSRVATELGEIKHLLEKEQCSMHEEKQNEVTMHNESNSESTEEPCPACGAIIKMNDVECPNCGLTLQ